MGAIASTREGTNSISDELFYAGIDPNEMRFKRAGCFDAGVQWGGWGHIVMELGVEDRKKENE